MLSDLSTEIKSLKMLLSSSRKESNIQTSEMILASLTSAKKSIPAWQLEASSGANTTSASEIQSEKAEEKLPDQFTEDPKPLNLKVAPTNEDRNRPQSRSKSRNRKINEDL
jgi:hypothetical protein